MRKGIKRFFAGALSALMMGTVAAEMPASADVLNPKENKPLVVVSMGDSYSAGEGIDDFYDYDLPLKKKVKSDDWLAHRSQNSWPGMLEVEKNGRCLRLNACRVDKYDTSKDVNWFFVAASGAETYHLTHKFKKPYNKIYAVEKDENGEDVYLRYIKTKDDPDCPALAPQINVFKNNNLYGKVDYVTMTLGGNDVDFAKIITKAVTDYENKDKLQLNISHAIRRKESNGPLTKLFNEVWKKWNDSVRKDLKNCYKMIKAAAGSQAYIIVAGYPKLIYEYDLVDPVINNSEAKLINNNVTKFNQAIKELVEECDEEYYGGTGHIVFVDVEDSFDQERRSNHSAYAPTPYINKIITLSKRQDIDDSEIPSAYSIHPNKKGAEVYARCVQKAIESIEDKKAGSYSDANDYNTDNDIIGAFGTHRYMVVNGDFTWREAKLLCECYGGHLATINSVEEQEFVSRFVHRQEGSSFYWLGASDEANEGTWTWVTGEPFSYQNWNEGEPNEFFDDNTEDYLEFRIYQNNPESEYGDYDDGLYYWNDRREESLDGFICEWDNKANVGKSVITSGHRYEIIDTGLTWESAKAACEAKGGHLATITSQEEQNAVEVLLGNGHKHNYWLGGMIPEDTVIWITGEEPEYTSFGSWLPDKYLPDEDKLMIWRIESEYSETNRWNDLRSDGTCEDQDFYGLNNFGYICEWDNYHETDSLVGSLLNNALNAGQKTFEEIEPIAAVTNKKLSAAPADVYALTNLKPNTVYNIYAFKNKADGLTPDNLMYINQLTTDGTGELDFEYGLKEDTEVDWIAVPFKSGNTEGLAEVTVIPAFAQNEERTYTDITLTVDGTTFTADSTGKITITGLENGTYEAVISKPNYAPVNVTITVGGENADVTIYKYGDADKNGKVDQSDLALLQKYSAGWNVTVDKPIADVTLDGKVNGEDIALMQKYFAGWNVTLGKVS